MMAVETYQQLIIEGIKGLSPEILAEITDFIYFVRKRAQESPGFADEPGNVLLGMELKQSSQNEETHLEKEFEGYDQMYPRE